jgi:hypothetical protein
MVIASRLAQGKDDERGASGDEAVLAADERREDHGVVEARNGKQFAEPWAARTTTASR